MERVRCLLSYAQLPQKFLAEAATYAVHTINRYPHTANQFLTPEEKWSKHPPKIDDLRVFGCIGYVHLNQGKLKPRAIRCMFVGFTEGVKDYRLWHPTDRRCINSRDVIFREEEMFLY